MDRPSFEGRSNYQILNPLVLRHHSNRGVDVIDPVYCKTIFVVFTG